MAIYITGDTHGDFQRFGSKYFPQQKEMSRGDYVVIAGDFGGLWDGSQKDQYWLDWLNKKPFTTLFVDGNHENFDLLNTLPEKEWNGGRVHVVREHVLHLMRGQVPIAFAAPPSPRMSCTLCGDRSSTSAASPGSQWAVRPPMIFRMESLIPPLRTSSASIG